VQVAKSNLCSAHSPRSFPQPGLATLGAHRRNTHFEGAEQLTRGRVVYICSAAS